MMGLPMHLNYGDSMVILSWINRLSALDVPTLMHWCNDIRIMFQMAPPVIFKHIFREHKSLVDGLSKQALNLDMGYGNFSETLDGMVINRGQLVLF